MRRLLRITICASSARRKLGSRGLRVWLCSLLFSIASNFFPIVRGFFPLGRGWTLPLALEAFSELFFLALLALLLFLPFFESLLSATGHEDSFENIIPPRTGRRRPGNEHDRNDITVETKPGLPRFSRRTLPPLLGGITGSRRRSVII